MKFEDLKKQIEDNINHDVIQKIEIRKVASGYKDTDWFVQMSVWYVSDGFKRTISFKDDALFALVDVRSSPKRYFFPKEKHEIENVGKYIADSLSSQILQDETREFAELLNTYCRVSHD